VVWRGEGGAGDKNGGVGGVRGMSLKLWEEIGKGTYLSVGGGNHPGRENGNNEENGNGDLFYYYGETEGSI